MEFWAIKHVPTGCFLPAPRGRGGRGGTHVEASDAETPRLFRREQDAKTALKWWLQGAVVVTVSEWDGEYDERWHTKHKPERRADEMAVVKVTLVEAAAL
jgi:hypothetical protein